MLVLLFLNKKKLFFDLLTPRLFQVLWGVSLEFDFSQIGTFFFLFKNKYIFLYTNADHVFIFKQVFFYMWI